MATAIHQQATSAVTAAALIITRARSATARRSARR